MLFPGRLLHEWTHAKVGGRWATDVVIDWHRPAVTFHWDDAPVHGVLLAHLAPFILGYTVGGLLVALVLLEFLLEISILASIWLVANWLWYSFPTPQDLAVLQYLR